MFQRVFCSLSPPNAVFWPFEFDAFYFYVCSCSGKTHDDTLLAKFESIYTGSGDHGSTMVSLNPLLEITLSSFLFFFYA